MWFSWSVFQNNLLKELLHLGKDFPRSEISKDYDGAFQICSPRPHGKKEDRKNWVLIMHHGSLNQGNFPHLILKNENPHELLKEGIQALQQECPSKKN